MKIEINLEKHHIYFLAVIAAVFFVAGVAAAYTPAQFGHSDAEISNLSAYKIIPGYFGNGDFGFPANLTVDNFIVAKEVNATVAITLGTDRRTAWPSGAVTSQLPASNISAGTFGNKTGNGDFGFPANLNVSANLTVDNFIVAKEVNATVAITLGTDRRTAWPSGAVTSQLPASNISAGTFGNKTGNGDFGFPGAVNVSSNFFLSSKDDPLNSGIYWGPNTRGIPVWNLPHIDYASPSSGYTPGLYIYGGQASPTIYLTSSNVIVDVGNVGIGTSSPAAKLEVSGGPIKATGGLILNTTNADPATPVPGQIWLRTDIG